MFGKRALTLALLPGERTVVDLMANEHATFSMFCRLFSALWNGIGDQLFRVNLT